MNDRNSDSTDSNSDILGTPSVLLFMLSVKLTNATAAVSILTEGHFRETAVDSRNEYAETRQFSR